MNTDNMIFVFGSNEAGIHGAGAAHWASRNRGARYGCGFGHMGNSFAIPTKDRTIQHTLSLRVIRTYVDAFITYAGGRPDLEFQVTCIGCGLAGLKNEDIAPMFVIHPSNCFFDKLWEPHLLLDAKYWGSF